MILTTFLAVAFSGPQMLPINHVSMPASQSSFTFLVMGDNRPIMGGLAPTKTFREILKEAAVIGPQFVLSTGDLVFGYGDTNRAYTAECEAVKGLVNKLPVPFINVPGNHEMASNPSFESIYHRLMGKSYGSFQYGGYTFLAVSTDETDSTDVVSGNQMTWLQSALSSAGPKFVWEHRPVFARAGVTEKGATIQPSETLASMYTNGQVQAVFEGHDHVNNVQDHGGVKYVIAGGSGAPLDAVPSVGGYFGYDLVEVSPNGIKYLFIPMDALQVTHTKNGAIVGDYTKVNIPINNLQIVTSFRPKTLVALEDFKGKKKPLAVKFFHKKKIGHSWVSTVSFVATHHHADIFEVKG